MKRIIYISILIYLLFTLCSCDTKQNWIDTGISSPYHQCSIMEYLRGDEYNWHLTTKMIERAELVDLFEGKVDSLPEITFLAIPSYSIERYLLDNNLNDVEELSVEFCRTTILNHVIKGSYLKCDIAYRDLNYIITDPMQKGGTPLKSLGGKQLIAYVDKTEYGGVPEAGAEIMYLYSVSAQIQVPLASPDIQPLNGVVHALNYNFVLGRI